MDAFLVQHAAAAYRTDAALVRRAFELADPFPLPASFLKLAKWDRSDHDTPEHNAYLVARWVASLQAAGLSNNAILDTMTTQADVSWQAPWYYRIYKKWRGLNQQ